MPLTPLAPSPSTTLFIDVEYFKSIIPISKDTDEYLIQPSISRVQDLYLMTILGSGVMADLRNNITGGTYTGLNYMLLYEYVRPCHAYYAAWDLIPHLVYRMTQKGLQIKSSNPDSASATQEDIEYYRKEFLNTAEYYAQRCIQFLSQNQESFPFYTNPGSGVDTIFPGRSNYTAGGLFIPNGGYNNVNGPIPYGLGLTVDLWNF